MSRPDSSAFEDPSVKSFKTSAEFMNHDLALSGITYKDVFARPISLPELAACDLLPNTMGYVLPYFDLAGSTVPAYRVRLYNHHIRYKQPKAQPNRIYFPKNLQLALQGKNYIVICEGEKKAVCACSRDIPTVALSGVDSWRNRTLVIPSDVQTTKIASQKGQKAKIGIKLPSGTEELDDITQSTLAEGFIELVSLAIKRKLHIVIAFDSDEGNRINDNVQRAAATLGFELRFRGIPFSRISQFNIPNITDSKIGFDDYVLGEEEQGKNPSKRIIDTLGKRGSFPRHPNLREFLNKRLQRTKLGRKETQLVALAILTDLDSRGRRLRASDAGLLYYFDSETKHLVKVHFSGSQKEENHESDFGRLLYKRYGLSGADQRVLLQLSAQYSGEDPIDDVIPQRVIHRTKSGQGDFISYQINDGQYVRVGTKKESPIELCDNGQHGVLFEAGHVEALDARRVLEEFRKQIYDYDKGSKTLRNRWLDVFRDTRIRDPERTGRYASYLYYISPWLWRWRGTQLPIEIVVGEAGSGKSSLCELRLRILTGDPRLRNVPQDLKDWHASVVNSGALHVTDNVQFADKNLRQRLSDELCRLVTEPTPYVEQRKYYSNTDLIRLPVTATFGITAIQQPFQNVDILQRSIIIEMDKAPDPSVRIEYESNWTDKQLAAGGGRVGWIAHQLVVLHLLLREASTHWDYTYKAGHRLVNFEYLLTRVAKLFGDDPSQVAKYLTTATMEKMSDADWALEGLRSFVSYLQDKGKLNEKFTAGEVCSWAMGHEEFQDCIQLTNARKLGRYLTAHKHTIAEVCHIIDAGMYANKRVYRYAR